MKKTTRKKILDDRKMEEKISEKESLFEELKNEFD